MSRPTSWSSPLSANPRSRGPTPNSTDRSVLIRLADEGGVAYRTHGLGYMYIRHSDSHTWVRSESQLLNGSFEQWRGMRLPETDA